MFAIGLDLGVQLVGPSYLQVGRPVKLHLVTGLQHIVRAVGGFDLNGRERAQVGAHPIQGLHNVGIDAGTGPSAGASLLVLRGGRQQNRKHREQGQNSQGDDRLHSLSFHLLLHIRLSGAHSILIRPLYRGLAWQRVQPP